MKYFIRSLSLAAALVASGSLTQADTLANVYEQSLKNDPKLKGAEATYRANIETEKLSFSRLLPQITASGEYRENNKTDVRNQSATSPNTNDDIESDSTTLSLSLNQTLFDLSTWFSFRQGKELTKQAAAQLAADQQGSIIRVAETYFNVLRALDNLEASRAEERATQRQLEQTQQRFDVGLIAITDVHEARAVYDSTVVTRLTDEGNLATSYESLTALTGQSHKNLWLLSKDYPVIDPDPISRDAWVQFSLKNNNALKAAIFGMEAAKQNAASKKMGHAPKLTGNITYNDFEEKGDKISNIEPSDSSFETQSDGYSWRVTLSVPLYSGGGISAQRRQAYEQYNVALQKKIDTQRSVIRNARASHITVVNDVQRVKARQQAIVSTHSALDATEAGYKVGTRNIVDVLQAQRSLYAAMRNYSNSRYDYVINRLKLKQAAGTLTPQDIYDINRWMVEPDAPTANQYQGDLSL